MTTPTFNNQAFLEAMARMKQEDNRGNREIFLDLLIAGAEFMSPVELLSGDTESSQVQFTLLTNQEGQPFFPAFTSWDELRKFCGPKNQQTVLLTFDNYANMVLRDGRAAGFVIDPFGACLSFERDMISHLVQRKATQAPLQ